MAPRITARRTAFAVLYQNVVSANPEIAARRAHAAALYRQVARAVPRNAIVSRLEQTILDQSTLGAMEMEAKHPELVDLPNREGKNTFNYYGGTQ